MFALTRHGEPRLLKKPDNIGAVGDAPGLHLAAHRRVHGGEQFLPALAESFGDVNCAPPGGVIGTAQAVFDVDRPFPGIEQIVVAAVVVNGDVPAGVQIGFNGGDVKIWPDGLGHRMNFVGVADDQHIQRIFFQSTAQQVAEVIEDGRCRYIRNVFLKTQDDAAVFLGKLRAVNQPLCDRRVAAQDTRGLVPQLVTDGSPSAAEHFNHHNASIAARMAANSTAILTASTFSPVRAA